MSPSMVMTAVTDYQKSSIHKKINDGVLESDDDQQYQKGVKHLCKNGISEVPKKYVLPLSDRPAAIYNTGQPHDTTELNLKLPVIDLAQLRGPNRSQVLQSLAHACENYGFFQLVNHGIPEEVTTKMMDVGGKFFELPFEELEKYMSTDMRSPVRYGTSFNQTKDGVFCWRDFLKLVSHPLPNVLPHWPSSPFDFRNTAVTYSSETRDLFLTLADAILESLGPKNMTKAAENDEQILKDLENGSQLMVVNCYPPCPEPELTLGMHPHSDYGFLTFVLQDEVKGLQIQSQNQWHTIEPVPGSFVVNVGDHLEIFSNGRYKSVLHRVLVNSMKSRISVASLHSLPFECTVRPWPKLIGENNPKRYLDTDFSHFLEYVTSCDSKKKNFLESRKLWT